MVIKTHYLKCKDYAVSGRVFDLLYDETKDMLITSPVPKQEELSKYYESEDYISHSDSRRNSLEWVYGVAKKWSINRKLKQIEIGTGKHKTLLDVGAGTGDFLKAAKSMGWQIAGVEPASGARELAMAKQLFLEEEIYKIRDQQFDVITLWHVLEHVAPLDQYIAYLLSLLKPDGTLYVAVPNFKSFDAIKYGSFWAAYDVPRHLWHFSPKAIKLLFGKHNANVVKILPMKLDAYYIALLSEKYKASKFPWLKALLTGWHSNRKAKQTGNYSSLTYVIKKEE